MLPATDEDPTRSPQNLTAEKSNPSSVSDLSSTEIKVRLGFAFAMACLAAIALISFLSMQRLGENTAWVEHTYDVLGRLQSLIVTATDSETSVRGYVITGDENYLLPYKQGIATLEGQVNTLRDLTADNPLEQRRLYSVSLLISDRLAELRTVSDLRRDHGFAAAQNEVLTGKGKQFHDQVRQLVAEMRDTELGLLAERQRKANQSSDTTRAVTIGGGLLALAIVGLSLIAIRRDFIGRAAAEQALRDSNEHLEVRVRQRTAALEKAAERDSRLASIIESSDDAITSKSLAGIITSWNPGAERLFGYSAQEALSKPMSMLLLPEYISEEQRILAAIARGEQIHRFETVRLHKEGRRIDVSITISPIHDGKGRVIGASTIAHDITDRKLGETRVQAQLARLNLLQQVTRAIGERQDTRSIFQVVIRTLEEQLPLDFCCICLYDPSQNQLIVNGIGTRSETVALELALSERAPIEIDQNGLSRCVRGQLVYEPDISQVPFPFSKRLATGGLRAMVAAPLLVESAVFGVLVAARKRPHSFSSGECEFLKQASEHVALAAHQAQLHTALQQAYDDLRQTQRALLQQERLRALGQMSSGIAHDINNAISPASLYIESLLTNEPDLSPRGRGQLETIQRAMDDVAQTVARMREFYRKREPALTFTPINLNSVIGQVIDLTRARWSDMAQQRGVVIDIRTELTPGLPPIMGADNELREAFTNLIFNAVDAMPIGGPLTLRTSLGTDGHVVQVEVADSGTGMDEDTRRRCLEPFFTTKGERGTGMGLAMVYGTMQRHAADLDIDSTPGQGTTVRLSFAAAAHTASGHQPASSPTAVLKPLNILVVDDDPLVLNALRSVLESDGHLVETADGGQAGIDAFLAACDRNSPFQVVITDLGMPNIDGRKVSSAIKGAAPATLVLLLTGWGQRLVADGDIPPHVDQVLGKPPKHRELRQALMRAV